MDLFLICFSVFWISLYVCYNHCCHCARFFSFYLSILWCCCCFFIVVRESLLYILCSKYWNQLSYYRCCQWCATPHKLLIGFWTYWIVGLTGKKRLLYIFHPLKYDNGVFYFFFQTKNWMMIKMFIFHVICERYNIFPK